MKKIISLSASILMLLSSITPAFAWDISIIGNGADSRNRVRARVQRLRERIQQNENIVENEVEIEAETGENKAEDNTGGDTEVKSGDTNTGIFIQNEGSENNSDDDCGCPDEGDVMVEIKENGADSDNKVEFDFRSRMSQIQSNINLVKNEIKLELQTGENEADDNTGGDTHVESGNVETVVEIINGGNINELD